MSISFEELDLSKEILKAVQDMGFEEASPIQELAIPHLLKGKDVIGQAQTGTGKTAAFGIPVLERLDVSNKDTQAIILCPTRELAVQVSEELITLAARKKGVSILPVYGGQPIERQFRALEKGVQIVVGTPGRVMDHMDRGTIRLNTVRMTVLDEADEMLNMGFLEDIKTILQERPEGGQTVLFSATMPPPILKISERFLHDPEILRIQHKSLVVSGIEQIYYEVRPYQKMEALCRVLDSQDFRKALIFCSTRRGVDEMISHLQSRGYQAEGLHGELAQSQRDRVMSRFRSGDVDVLAATDVAARGLDVNDVDVVVNYDIPYDVENYVHRIGRTGRAGSTGMAFTFVTLKDYHKLREIMRYTKAEITQKRLPSVREVANIKTARLLDQVREMLEAEDLERYASIIENFAGEEISSMDMASALLKLLMQREFGVLEEVKDEEVRPEGSDKPRGYVRLFFNVGRKMNVAPRDIVGAIAGELGISARKVGAIEIQDSFSFVEVEAGVADEVIKVMNTRTIRGLNLNVEVANPSQGGSSQGGAAEKDGRHRGDKWKKPGGRSGERGDSRPRTQKRSTPRDGEGWTSEKRGPRAEKGAGNAENKRADGYSTLQKRAKSEDGDN